MDTNVYKFVRNFFIASTLFLTNQLTAQTTTACAKYEVISTNNICGCTSDLFRPYGLFVEANNTCGLEFFKPDTVIFEIRNDSTAAIRGVFRTFAGWRPVRVDITMAKLPSGTPRLDLCLNSSPSSVANAWRYFGVMSGTIQFDSAAPLSVSLRGSNFQVGIGANGQNLDQFGGSGFFTLSNGQRGGFGFTLTNPTSGTCLLVDSCQNETKVPVFSNCPQKINLTTAGTNAVATWTAPTATDNCSTPSVSSNFASGASFPIGTTVVIYTAKDAANNTAQCRFNVVVTRLDPCLNDATSPVFSNCPQNINLTTAGTNAVATWTAPTATDNCTPPSVTSNFASGSSFPIGTTTVIYTAKDAANNTAQCRFNVVVTRLDPCLDDRTPPVFSNCPQNINLTTTSGSVVATWAAPTATDSCSTPSVMSNFVSGAPFGIGTTTVIYTARDAANNTSECRFNVVVTRLDPCLNDETPPVFSNCPQNRTVATLGSSAVATWTAPTATDNCSTPSVTSNFVSGSSFPLGTTTVIYTARDASNNNVQCRFTVTVIFQNPCIGDTTPPVVVCPPNISLTTTSTSAVATWTTPPVTDNCAPFTIASNFRSGTAFPLGTTTVVYTASDVAGNTAQCHFTVTVTYSNPCQNDVTAPAFVNCPQNINLTTTGTNAMATWATPVAVDNCMDPSVSSNFASGASFPLGTTTVIYTARDTANNVGECLFNVIVRKQTATAGICTSYAVESTNDICSCPTNQWMPFGFFIDRGNGCGDYYKADKVDFQVNGDSTARLVGVFRTSTWRPVWLDIQWSKTNQKTPRFSTCANDTAASQAWRYFGTAQGNIQFDDEHPLSITSSGLMQLGTGANGQNRDLFGASGRVVLGDGRVGSINIVLYNPISSTCDLTCVNDTVKPKILNCPQNVTKMVVQAPVAVTWAAPSVRDDCSSPTLTTTHLPNALFPEGETNVVYTARDVSGNQSTCTFKVAVTKAPAGSLCASYSVTNTNDNCGCSANQWKPYALRIGNGNCGEYFKADSVVLHINGDSSAQLQGIFRSDYWAPVVVDVRFAKTSGRTPRFELCQSNNSFASEWQYFGDMTGIIKIGESPAVAIQSGTLLQVGKGANGQNPEMMGGNVNFTLPNGLSASLNLVLNNHQQFTCANFNACAGDGVKPTFNNCPRDTTIQTAQSSAVVRWTTPTAADNCSTPSVSSNFVSGTTFPLGATTVTYTARDSAGNSEVCRFTVTVARDICIDDTAPPVFFTCPANIVDSTTGTSKVVSWAAPTVTDNCSTPSVTSNFPSGLPFNIGSTIIVLTARDAAGNTSKCNFTITIKFITGITEPNTNISALSVVPNPATQLLTLELQSRLTEDARLDITNALGQTVFQQKINVKAGENRLPIDVSFLVKGVYYLTVRDTQFNAPRTIRFMKI